MNRLLLCTDMDRTIIPNGRQPEHPQARRFFKQLCNFPDVNLVYVTGRHLQLLEDALQEYNLPEPDYAITDVGTKIYKRTYSDWQALESWQDQIAKDWQGKTHVQLQKLLSKVSELQPQEQSKQSDYKLSYYLPLNADHKTILSEVEDVLVGYGVAASLVMSIDAPAQIGLLDVLPERATKLHAILFLQQQLGYPLDEIIFSGDSGNDLIVLGSQVPSILVANADKEVKQQAVQRAKDNGNTESLYLAEERGFCLGGNYSAGVVQGIIHYIPEIRDRLEMP